jgi:hypothetical protein
MAEQLMAVRQHPVHFVGIVVNHFFSLLNYKGLNYTGARLSLAMTLRKSNGHG